MKNKGKKVKIKEIPSKIKNIKEIPRQNSQSSDTTSITEEHESSSQTSSSNLALIISNIGSVSSSSQQVQPELQEKDDSDVRAFYASTSNLTAEQLARKYEISRASTSLTISNPLTEQSRINNMENEELRALHPIGQESIEKNYSLDKPREERPRRRYPWEV